MFLTDCLGINEKNNLTIGGLDVADLAKEFGTPLYLMDEDKIRENCRIYKNAMEKYYGKGLVLYASKAFSCRYICRLVAEEGMGLDVVSGGELYTAISAGFPMDKVYFHGNNKTAQELTLAVDNNVGRIVVDNISELEMLSSIAKSKSKTVSVLFRIKPGIEAHTHEFISTGRIDSKFGVALETGEAEEIIKYAKSLANIDVVGVHCHIGSQIFDIDPFLLAAEKMTGFIADIKDRHGIEIAELNLGGGFGIKYLSSDDPVPYDEYIKAVSGVVKDVAKKRGLTLPKILMEPGRSIVAPAGITVYTVGAVKEIPNIRTYVSVDGGMCDNPRYIMYGSEYEAVVVGNPLGLREKTVTIAGKCCESGDILVKDIALPLVKAGDLIAVLATGAYNYSMASNYNRISRPPVVMVSGKKARLAIRRESYEDLMRNDL
ncbi:MAG: Diaminopimelate decarboxylase [Firmicutes bacterium ADurb.Bin193]|nr:MAG: Diaminopimelate decarboxylase [Firmicutes bacterium ADurb.Bin193]